MSNSPCLHLCLPSKCAIFMFQHLNPYIYVPLQHIHVSGFSRDTYQWKETTWKWFQGRVKAIAKENVSFWYNVWIWMIQIGSSEISISQTGGCDSCSIFALDIILRWNARKDPPFFCHWLTHRGKALGNVVASTKWFRAQSNTSIRCLKQDLCLLPWYESFFRADQSSLSPHVSICPYIQDLRLPWHESLLRGDQWVSCPQGGSSITRSVSRPRPTN